MNDSRDAKKADVPDQQHRKGAKRNTMDPNDTSTWPTEFGGQSGPEPTRYGDWEKNGRCTDF
ncbi:MAG: succinate dehydrogenase assembly factor 4 [Aquisalimonadaceae bacterium]